MSQPKLLFCIYLCQLQTHHMDLVQTSNKHYWQNFGIFYIFLISTTTFFGRNILLVLKNYNFFNMQQVTF